MVVFSLLLYGFYEGKLRNASSLGNRLAEQFPKWRIIDKAQNVANQPDKALPLLTESYNITALNEAIQRMLWTVHEMQEFLSYEIKNLRTLTGNVQNLKEKLYRFEQLTGDYTNVLTLDLENLDKMLHLKELRVEKWKNLTTVAQMKIVKNQNPENCSNVGKLCCSLNIGDGLAAQMNMLFPCHVKSFYSGKLLQLRTQNWPYIRGSTWENYFQPYSNTCRNETFLKDCGLSCNLDRKTIVSLPEDMAEDIRFLGVNPLAWLYGQFNGYVMRPSARMLEVIKNAKNKLGYNHPIVALQVRKTDKIGREAIDHPVEDYMVRADRFFNKLQLESSSIINRTVFVASDEPNVTIELRHKYPNHTFINNPRASQAAQNRSTRYSLSALEDLIIDIYLLASADYIVCTFSSGVCRLAFEVMQYLQPDSLLKSASLDVAHHFVFAMEPPERVFYDHSPLTKKEISLIRGDSIEKDAGAPRYQATGGKLHDGFSYGKNTRTKMRGDFPSFKAFPILLNHPYDNFTRKAS